jgi:predicted DNA-binding protein
LRCLAFSRKDFARVVEAVETEEDTTRLNVRVPTPLYERFKDKVESEGRTMTWVVLQAIRDYLTE